MRYLFNALLCAGQVLKQADDVQERAREALPRLAPTRIGSDGRIMEWLEEYEEPLPYHRHVSHLWGLFPGDEITKTNTPALAAAALKSLQARGDASADWAIAYRACLYARLGEPALAYEMAQRVLLQSTFPNLLCKCHHAPEDQQPARMPQEEDYHFPYQMDGNMGIFALYGELLLQSTVQWKDGLCYTLHLLPCLPEKRPDGKVEGLRGKGGFTVDLTRKSHRPSGVKLSGEGQVTLQVGEKSRTVLLAKGDPLILTEEELETWS